MICLTTDGGQKDVLLEEAGLDDGLRWFCVLAHESKGLRHSPS